MINPFTHWIVFNIYTKSYNKKKQERAERRAKLGDQWAANRSKIDGNNPDPLVGMRSKAKKAGLAINSAAVAAKHSVNNSSSKAAKAWWTQSEESDKK